MYSRGLMMSVLVAAGIALVNATTSQAQTNITASQTNLSRLMKPANWAAGGGGTYYKWNTVESLPQQTLRSWGTIKDYTRVGDGQCVDFVKLVSNTVNTATTSWIKGSPVVASNGTINPIPGGTAIATFNAAGKYSSEHVMIVLSRVGDSLVVAEQNVLTGRDQAKIVSKRTVPANALRSYFIVRR